MSPLFIHLYLFMAPRSFFRFRQGVDYFLENDVQKSLSLYVSHTADVGARTDALEIYNGLNERFGPSSCTMATKMNDASPRSRLKAIDRCDVFVCVLSESIWEYGDAMIELLYAHRKGKFILPVHGQHCNVGAVLAKAPDYCKWLCELESTPVIRSNPKYFKTTLDILQDKALKKDTDTGNEDAPSVFLSHVQRESSPEAAEIYHHFKGRAIALQKHQSPWHSLQTIPKGNFKHNINRGNGIATDCWLDYKMDDKSSKAMEDGIRNCSVFVCIQSASYGLSSWCRKELEWAKKYHKPIVYARVAGMEKYSIYGNTNAVTIDCSTPMKHKQSMRQLRDAMRHALRTQ